MFAPKISTRGVPKGEGISLRQYKFPEISLAFGPLVLGDTGQNRLIDFIGREWLLELRRDNTLHLYREDLENDGVWIEQTTLLPPQFATELPVQARHLSHCFDQSSRVIFAYEENEEIKVTRWDTATNQYVQNVSFAGVDPCVVFDAIWAYNISESDVLLFYLSSDRTKVMCRVQRELYAVEHEISDQGEARVMDRVIRLPLRYMVLLSDSEGEPLRNEEDIVTVLVSDLYPYPEQEILNVDAHAEDVVYEQTTFLEEVSNLLVAYARAEDVDYVGNVAITPVDPDALTAGAHAEDVEYVGNVFINEPDPDGIVAVAGAEDVDYIYSIVIEDDEDGLTGGAHAEDVIYRQI